MRNKEFGYRVEQSHASGRRYLSNPVHTQRSGGCAGDARIERSMPHASGRRHLRNPVHTQRSRVCAGGCDDRETHNSMSLEDAIYVTPYIRSVAEYVRGDAVDARIESHKIQRVWKTLSP